MSLCSSKLAEFTLEIELAEIEWKLNYYNWVGLGTMSVNDRPTVKNPFSTAIVFSYLQTSETLSKSRRD